MSFELQHQEEDRHLAPELVLTQDRMSRRKTEKVFFAFYLTFYEFAQWIHNYHLLLDGVYLPIESALLTIGNISASPTPKASPSRVRQAE